MENQPKSRKKEICTNPKSFHVALEPQKGIKEKQIVDLRL